MTKRQKNKRKRSIDNMKVFGTPEYLGKINIPTSVELIQYNEKDFTQRTLSPQSDFKKQIKKDFTNWFKVTGFSDVEYINRICRDFGLHSFDIRELLADANFVKVVLYDDVTFSLISGYYLNDERVMEDMQIAFILGDNFVISFKEAPLPVFNEVERAISENNITLRKKGADFLLYILFNTINSFNNNFITMSEDYLLEIEDQLIMQNETIDVLHTLSKERMTPIRIKRFMSSLREEFENLLENTNNKIKPENLIYFENLDDKFRTVSSNIYSYEELVKSLIDLYYNNNEMKMNKIMKRLTVVATVFIPLTFLVGVWGMNFDIMPELKWKYGYLMSWGLFIVIAGLVILLMKKKKWL